MDDGIIKEYYRIILDKINHANFDGAIRSADKLLSYYDNDAGAFYYKGVASFALEKYMDAVRFFSKSLEIDPVFAKAYFNLGATLYISNKYDDALINIGKALILFSKEGELDCKDRCMHALTYIQDERRA